MEPFRVVTGAEIIDYISKVYLGDRLTFSWIPLFICNISLRALPKCIPVWRSHIDVHVRFGHLGTETFVKT